MRVLGLDLGDARIGVAISDGAGLLATPYETVYRSGDRSVDHGEIQRLVAETGAEAIVAGMPYSLDGSIGHKAKLTRRELLRLEKVVTVPVHTQDERFTTTTAEQSLRVTQTKGAKKRAVVDQVAAAVILQAWLDGERAAPGRRRPALTLVAPAMLACASLGLDPLYHLFGDD
ncbi:MAG: Holliday junction resolvase RuvX [Acidimicrobiales bacterium]